MHIDGRARVILLQEESAVSAEDLNLADAVGCSEGEVIAKGIRVDGWLSGIPLGVRRRGEGHDRARFALAATIDSCYLIVHRPRQR